jgi:hypothetical protein
MEAVMDRRFFAGPILVGLLVLPSATVAQTPPSSSADARAFSGLDVRIGDTLIVQTRDALKVKGTLLSITDDQLTLAVGGVPRTVLAADVQSMKRKRFGVLLGPIVGAGTGFALGLVAASDAPAPGFTGEQDLATPVVIIATLAGTGVGFAIDAVVNIPRTVYRREVRLSAVPVVTRQATGISVQLAF